MGINKFLTKFFGNKSDRDLREIQPYVDKINKIYPEIKSLSNDELRAKTQSLMQELQDAVSEETQKVQALRDKVADGSVAFDARETLYDDIDKLEKIIVEKLEQKLDEITPVAYAYVKDPARRFT